MNPVIGRCVPGTGRCAHATLARGNVICGADRWGRVATRLRTVSRRSESTWPGDRIRVVIGSSSPVVHADPPPACREEEAFYARYDWCLNPILTVGQLLQRLEEEVEAAPGPAAAWQREEARINVYLFVCAIAGTVDDYLSRPLGDLSPIAAHFPRLRPAVSLAEYVQRGAESVRGVIVDRTVARWDDDGESAAMPPATSSSRPRSPATGAGPTSSPACGSSPPRACRPACSTAAWRSRRRSVIRI